MVDKKISPNMKAEEFVPSSGWTQDADAHCLIVDLPGFKKEQVMLQSSTNGHIIVSGGRPVNDNKYIRFEQSYDVPEDSTLERTTARFEDEILYVIIPKKKEIHNVDQQHSGSSTPLEEDHDDYDTSDDDDDDQKEQENEEEKQFHDAKLSNHWSDQHDAKLPNHWSDQSSRSLLEKVKKRKMFIITAVLAFSLGVLVSQKLTSNGAKEYNVVN